MPVAWSDSELVVPGGRQGPGPMPAAILDALDPALQRLLSRTLPGVRRARGVGQGTELAQLRPYVEGDDVRYLDAAASARTGTMHVRLSVPERALSTWIVIDLSASMAFGTAQRLKADVAEGVARLFGRLGVRRAGSVGVVAFGAGTAGEGMRVLAPRAAQPGLIALGRLLDAGVAPDGADAGAGLAAALSRALGVIGQPGLLVTISDFREPPGWERPLGALALRHSVIAVEVGDPREASLPDVGRLRLIDPESGRMVSVDAGSPRLRERFAQIEAERRAAIAAELRRLHVHHVRLSTDEDWLRELGRQIR